MFTYLYKLFRVIDGIVYQRGKISLIYNAHCDQVTQLGSSK